MADFDVVTGAFGYTGRYLAQRLLQSGRRVRSLTNHPQPSEVIPSYPFTFEEPQRLVEALAGATTLYNTYWVRFNRGSATFDRAVANTKILLSAARQAGVRRLVQVSIANSSASSPFPYYRGKAQVEAAVRESGLSYAIVRPTMLYGDGDVLLNNVAWLLRHLPAFGIPGDGRYRLQPIYVHDFVDLMYQAAGRDENLVMDAVGPETFSFIDLVRLIRRAVGSRAIILHLLPGLALLGARLAGGLVRDVVLTQEEVQALMEGLLASTQAPTGNTRLTEWLAQNSATIGIRYASELRRH